MADDEETLGNPLSIQDDEYDVVHEVPLAVARHVPSRDEARALARGLIEHGVGATVGAAGGPDGFEVRVLPEEVVRARELLETAESGATGESGESGGGPSAGDHPDGGRVTGGAPAADAGPGAAVPRAPVPWKTLAAIWVAAMVLLPLLTFLATYLLSR